MDGIYTVASSSSSVTYGNISCAIKELLLSKFPYDFFKYVNISSELAFRNFKRQFGSNNTDEMRKRVKPYLIINPIYSVNSDIFLYDTPLTKNFDNIQYGVDKRYMFDIMIDKEKGFGLKYKMNRDKIDFEVSIVLPTLHQQIDVYKAIVNQIVWDRPYAYRASLEALIPRSMISHIGALLHMDIDKKETSIPIMIQYLNRISSYPITYKMKNASSRDEFFMYYNHDIIVNFSDLSLERGTKKNMVDDSYEITFRISAEFNLPGLYILEGKKENINILKIDLVSKDYYSGDREFIPITTYNNFYNQYPTYKDGFRLYISSIFNVDAPKQGKDVLPIDELFNDNITSIIKENLSYNVSMNTIVKLIIIKDNVELKEGEDWTVNWNTFEVSMIKPEPSSTYRIVIYLNSVHVNERLLEITNNKSTEKASI